MELNEYLAAMIGLGFIYIIIWYMTIVQWVPESFLNPISQILGFIALVLTAIFVVSKISE